VDHGLERGALLAELLGALRIIPDAGLAQLQLYFGEPLLLVSVVKDTP
jgi:hypothetical protein